MYREIRFSWAADARVAVTPARGRGTTGTQLYEGHSYFTGPKMYLVRNIPHASAPDALIASVQNVMSNQKGFEHQPCQNQKGII